MTEQTVTRRDGERQVRMSGTTVPPRPDNAGRPAEHRLVRRGGGRGGSPELRNPRLLDQVREAVRIRHYSVRTEEAYVGWITRFILFHGKRHPREMGAPEVERFLSDLATTRHLAASTET